MADTKGGFAIPMLNAVDNVTLEINAAGEIQIKGHGVSGSHLAYNTVTPGKCNWSFRTMAYNSLITSAVQSKSITGLNGTQDMGFTLYGKFVNDNAGATATYTITLNSDAGANYDNLMHRASGGGAQHSLKTVGDNSSVGFCQANLGGDVGTFQLDISAILSGTTDRIINLKGGNQECVYNNNLIWRNSADNLTSIQLTGNQVDSIGVGSLFYMYSLKNY